ncbi:hypothetical protein BDFB_009116, partial [Asbolus verrucosus]
MFIFVVLGISNLKNQDNLTKLRLLSVAFCNGFVIALFCEGGQGLIDETGHIFNNLMDCPWYIWNTKNRLLLLTFMTNCLEPLKFSVAGIALDRQLTAS